MLFVVVVVVSSSSVVVVVVVVISNVKEAVLVRAYTKPMNTNIFYTQKVALYGKDQFVQFN